MVDFYSDYFTAEALTDAILEQQYVPGRLGELGIFENRPLAGTRIAIEEQPSNDASLITSTPRGTPSKAATLVRKKVHTFQTSHYREDSAVYADEVLDIRGSGVTLARDIITTRRDEVLALLRRKIDYTLEDLRLQCVNSPDNAFGSAPAAAVVAFGASDTAIRSAIFTNITKPMESALGGTPYTGLLALCDDTYWTALIESKTVRESYLNQQAANELRSQGPTDSFSYAGIRWERYRGAGTTVVTSGQAKIIPLGVPGLFIQGFAPADTLDSIGSGALGTPYYVQSYAIDGGNRGWHIEAQTNPVTVCTRPSAILSIDLS